MGTTEQILLDRRKLVSAALRSGRFKQGGGQLHAKNSDGTWRHCCLGVMCIVAMENGLSLPTHRSVFFSKFDRFAERRV
jgi:hypothetical protein